MKKDTQVSRLRAYLEKGGRVNPLNAWKELGIYRLSGRVFDLKQSIHVDSQWIEVVNSWGEKCIVKEFFINQKQ